ncbi:hypothetical protein NEFER03_1653 [Nematocida sp. LUAm3]|nr:hypothetical protein NEFER03_1653 [Nematocida sp. LUAm3]KAI5174677.1 hypothetical protein NEFER02_0787 [Nematocida sp. LUAm2]
MKKKEVDEYFQEKVTQVEEEERRPSIRRVSFALDPQVIYDASKEDSSKSENSLEVLLDVKEEELPEEVSIQENETLPLCEEGEENFIMEDSEESAIHEIAVKEQRKMSICTREQEITMEITNKEYAKGYAKEYTNEVYIEEELVPSRIEPHPSAELPMPQDTQQSASHPADIPADIYKETHTDIHADIHEEVNGEELCGEVNGEVREEVSEEGGTIVEEEESDIVSDMLSEIICTGENNTMVYDTVNVEEVLSKYETSKAVGAQKIKEILSESGIRFLDNLSLSNRRETISKVRNKVERKSIIYYEKYLQKRIEMQNTFSSYLAEEIEAIRYKTEALEREADCSELAETDRAILSTKLRQMKSDSRREGKNIWHAYRDKKEEEFLSEVRSAYCALKDSLKSIKEEIAEKERTIAAIKIDELQEEETRIREAIASVGSISEEELTRIMGEVEENRKLLKQLEGEQREVEQEENLLMEENKRVKHLLEREEKLAKDAKEKLLTEEVQKEEVERIKDEVEKMQVIFGVEVLEVTHTKILLRISDVELTLIYDGDKVVDISAETKRNTPFRKFICSSIRCVPKGLSSLKESLSSLLLYILEMTAIEKEIQLIGLSMHYVIETTEHTVSVTFRMKKGKEGRIRAEFQKGSTVPEVSSNIRGVLLDRVSPGTLFKITEQLIK